MNGCASPPLFLVAGEWMLIVTTNNAFIRIGGSTSWLKASDGKTRIDGDRSFLTTPRKTRELVAVWYCSYILLWIDADLDENALQKMWPKFLNNVTLLVNRKRTDGSTDQTAELYFLDFRKNKGASKYKLNTCSKVA